MRPRGNYHELERRIEKMTLEGKKGFFGSKTNWIGVLLMIKPVIHFTLYYFGYIDTPPEVEQASADVSAGSLVALFRTKARTRIG